MKLFTSWLSLATLVHIQGSFNITEEHLGEHILPPRHEIIVIWENPDYFVVSRR